MERRFPTVPEQPVCLYRRVVGRLFWRVHGRAMVYGVPTHPAIFVRLAGRLYWRRVGRD